MQAFVKGKFYRILFKKTDSGGYHELRILQKNDMGINTEVFPVFDADLANSLSFFKENDDINIDCDIYLKNGYLQKKINYVLDPDTGEKIA